VRSVAENPGTKAKITRFILGTLGIALQEREFIIFIIFIIIIIIIIIIIFFL